MNPSAPLLGGVGGGLNRAGRRVPAYATTFATLRWSKKATAGKAGRQPTLPPSLRYGGQRKLRLAKQDTGVNPSAPLLGGVGGGLSHSDWVPTLRITLWLKSRSDGICYSPDRKFLTISRVSGVPISNQYPSSYLKVLIV